MKWSIYPVVSSGVRRFLLSTLVIAVPTFSAAQHKNSPAPHASAPVHNSAPARPSQPAQQHATMPGRTNNGNTMNRPGTSNTTNRPGTANNSRTPMGNNGRTNNPTGMRGTNNTSGHNATNNTGNRNGNMGNRPGSNNNAMHAGNNARPGAAGHGATRTPPGHQVSLRGGGTANIRPNGQIRSVNRNGMHIEHGMHGGRTVVSTHNGVRVVSVGHRGGYVQRAYVVRGGHSYYSRTYYYHGAYRVGVYRGYYWGGRPYYGYYPAYYYQPVYYGWAYNPWPAPVYYGWGWGGAPWYGYYGPYYAPYPVYPSAAFWLTDFMIAASLQAAYEAQAASADNWMSPYDLNGVLVASMNPIAPPDPKPAMSDAVKKELSEEVKLTLAAEQAEAGKGGSGSAGGGQPTESKEAPPALDPKFRTFVVSSDMSLVPDGGDECPLAQGDVITRTSDTPDGDGNVAVKVVASAKNDCAIGTMGPVSTDDLQEMYNQFRDQLKDGMAELAKKNGSGGLPKAPDTGTTQGDVPPPAPDKSAEKSLQDQQQAADQTEADVKQEAGSGGGSQ